MGRPYQAIQRERVKELLEAGRDEDSIEKETGVSDRTIRRWKLELERTGKIGKPPEARTGRHRVLTAEVEAALFEHVKDKPEMSVDDMLWWLYDTYKIVVGTRTLRRCFERRGEGANRFKKGKVTPGRDVQHIANDEDDSNMDSPMHVTSNDHYQSPYAPMTSMTPQGNSHTELQLAQALQQQQPVYPPPPTQSDLMADMAEDEETLQLQLQQIALQKREVELKLKMRRLRQGKSPSTPVATSVHKPSTPQSSLSTLYKPEADVASTGPKRDSRSKKKIEESKRRTAERQERMLRDLERRSRRREHLTAEWVQSKDIWPLRAQGMLADLMHQYGCYTFSQNNIDTFEGMYRDLYSLVDHTKGDWEPHVHDEMLRERMRRKMGQLRSKMQKTGEIIGRSDGFGGWQKAEDYTGQHAGDVLGDETEADLQGHDPLQAHAGALGPPPHEDHIQYDPVPDPTQQQMQHAQLPYGNAPLMHHSASAQYPILDSHHPGMLPYGQLTPQQQGLGPQDGMVM